MLKNIWFAFSLFLILIIFLRMPSENNGLSSFMGNSNLFGSSTSTERNLNYTIGLITICYLLLAFYLNY
jgi:protein translocase SecG subunit